MNTSNHPRLDPVNKTENFQGIHFNDIQPLVIDIGHTMMKCGFSGDSQPRAVFPTIVGRVPKKLIERGRLGFKDVFVGDEAQSQSNRRVLNLKCPIPSNLHGSVNYKDLEKIFHHSFYNELSVTPEEHPLMISSLPYMKKEDFRKLSMLFFETFKVPGLSICDKSVLALFSTGPLTGQVVSIGGGITTTVSIYEGLPIHHSKFILEDVHDQKKRNIAGDLMTDMFFQSIQKNKVLEPLSHLPLVLQREIARDMKEKYLMFSIDRQRADKIPYLKELSKNREDLRMLIAFGGYYGVRTEWEKRRKRNLLSYSDIKGEVIEYEFNDRKYTQSKTIIRLGDERFDACEVLFRPTSFGYNLPGIHEMIKLSIERNDPDLHADLYKNIFLSGGSTMIGNLEEKLHFELIDIVPKKYKNVLKIRSTDERKFAPWIGGSIFTTLSTFDHEWVTKEEYEEYGYRIVEARCPFVTLDLPEQALKMYESFLDVDLEERMLYVLKQCFVSEKNNEEFEASFRICLDSCDLKIRFKSFLLL